MDSVKLILENGVQVDGNGIFYIYNGKYYLIYTTGEKIDDNYTQLYVGQICKEVQNTPSGPVETGYMLCLEINNPDEWLTVQKSIKTIMDDRRSGNNSGEIQYLSNNMLVNLKVISSNKFKLMSNLLKETFGLVLPSDQASSGEQNASAAGTETAVNGPQTSTNNSVPQAFQEPEPMSGEEQNINENEVIIDYRAKFFAEQEKNENLEEKMKEMQEKLDAIKEILQ